MMWRGPYNPARRAYLPGHGPLWVVSAVAYVALVLLGLYPLAASAASIVTTFAFGIVRAEVWRRRHPVISVEEYASDLRKVARWN